MWSVESFFDKIHSDSNGTTTYLCNVGEPVSPLLTKSSGMVITTDDEHEFNWTNPNKNEICGLKIDYTYDVRIAFSNGTVVYSNPSYAETSVKLKLGTGDYNWKVTTSNGFFSSDTQEARLSFCVPEDIP